MDAIVDFTVVDIVVGFSVVDVVVGVTVVSLGIEGVDSICSDVFSPKNCVAVSSKMLVVRSGIDATNVVDNRNDKQYMYISIVVDIIVIT